MLLDREPGPQLDDADADTVGVAYVDNAGVFGVCDVVVNRRVDAVYSELCDNGLLCSESVRPKELQEFTGLTVRRSIGTIAVSVGHRWNV